MIMPKEGLEIRFDDVLLYGSLTGSMKNSLRHNTFFGHFKEADKILVEYDFPCIMAIVARGIEEYPEWVQYVKERQSRYTLALHCWDHHYHHTQDEEEAYGELAKARDKIEETFGVKLERWYVPFGRMFFPEWGIRMAERLGLKFHTRGGTIRHRYFHYWNSRDRNQLKLILNNYVKH